MHSHLSVPHGLDALTIAVQRIGLSTASGLAAAMLFANVSIDSLPSRSSTRVTLVNFDLPIYQYITLLRVAHDNEIAVPTSHGWKSHHASLFPDLEAFIPGTFLDDKTKYYD